MLFTVDDVTSILVVVVVILAPVSGLKLVEVLTVLAVVTDLRLGLGENRAALAGRVFRLGETVVVVLIVVLAVGLPNPVLTIVLCARFGTGEVGQDLEARLMEVEVEVGFLGLGSSTFVDMGLRSGMGSGATLPRLGIRDFSVCRGL